MSPREINPCSCSPPTASWSLHQWLRYDRPVIRRPIDRPLSPDGHRRVGLSMPMTASCDPLRGGVRGRLGGCHRRGRFVDSQLADGDAGIRQKPDLALFVGVHVVHPGEQRCSVVDRLGLDLALDQDLDASRLGSEIGVGSAFMGAPADSVSMLGIAVAPEYVLTIENWAKASGSRSFPSLAVVAEKKGRRRMISRRRSFGAERSMESYKVFSRSDMVEKRRSGTTLSAASILRSCISRFAPPRHLHERVAARPGAGWNEAPFAEPLFAEMYGEGELHRMEAVYWEG